MRPRTAPQWVAVAVAAGLIVAIGLVTALHFAAAPSYMPTWQSSIGPKPVTSSDGRSIVLTYTGGECDRLAHVAVDESTTQVVLTITVTERSRSCSDVGVPRTITAHLTDPLDHRQLVDGALPS